MIRLSLESEEESRAAVDLAGRPDLAAVPVDDALDGGQANPGAFELSVAVKPLEGAEKFFGVLHVEARAVVLHEEDALAVLVDGAELDLAVGPLRREFPGVADEVAQ